MVIQEKILENFIKLKLGRRIDSGDGYYIDLTFFFIGYYTS